MIKENENENKNKNKNTHKHKDEIRIQSEITKHMIYTYNIDSIKIKILIEY